VILGSNNFLLTLDCRAQEIIARSGMILVSVIAASTRADFFLCRRPFHETKEIPKAAFMLHISL
jgi:23S rRNA A1618 N6-methylase RlmF